jgi:hypothetical protein
VPLPLKLKPLIEAGRRDALIQKLYAYTMPIADIVRITGAPHTRVQGVIRHAATGPTRSVLTPTGKTAVSR